MNGVEHDRDTKKRDLLREYRASQRAPKKKKRRRNKKRPRDKTKRLGNRFAKELKKKATRAEIVFKKKLQCFDFNINFQKPFSDGGRLYIADFYIPIYNLIIEVDGGYHNTKERREKDRERDDWFIGRGIRVWRITNATAFKITTNEMSEVFRYCKKRGDVSN